MRGEAVGTGGRGGGDGAGRCVVTRWATEGGRARESVWGARVRRGGAPQGARRR